MNGRLTWPLPILAAVLLGVSGCSRESAQRARRVPAKVEFNRHVRTILSDNCFACHGRDANKRKGDLRLDSPDSALAERKGKHAIVPGDPEQSELVRRINSTDPEYRMPPPASKRTLDAHEKAILTRWIEQGAEYQEHWAYRALQRPTPPDVTGKDWVTNPIDQFVRARLEEHDLEPSPEADRRALIRRLSFDLTGLPPTPAQVDAFAAADTSTAYQDLVERLLASPHYGERMATYWLDLVRFADTTGYNEDQPRNISLYRDYVINAFNANMRFDQFTIEQLAGDLLPARTDTQRIATGYNRLNKVSKENGSQPREFIAKYAADRVRTTASVWLGATLGCAECHDHKFDPYTAKDFYSFAAFFADVDENPVPPLMKVGMPPELAVPRSGTPVQVTRELEALKDQLAQVRASAASYTLEQRARLAAEQAAWEEAAAQPSTELLSSAPPFDPGTWIADGAGTTIDGSGRLHLVSSAAHPSNASQHTTRTGSTSLEFFLDLSTLRFPGASSKTIDWLEWNLRSAPKQPALFVRIARESNLMRLQVLIDPDDGRTVELGDPADVKSLKLRLIWNAPNREWSASYGLNGDPAVTPLPGGPVSAFLGDANEEWTETITALSYDPAEATAAPATAPPRLQAVIDRHVIRRYHPLADPPAEIAILRASAPAARTAQETDALNRYYLANTPELGAWNEQINALAVRKQRLEHFMPHSMVTEAATPQVTRVLHRGDWQDDSGEIVAPAVPAFLPSISTTASANRLDLARWLVSPDNPLTARTLVNRLWALFIGHGIVRTLDDLGAQGTPPSHPELLDWLAAELVDSGWDIKHMVRLIVTSAAYRQSSQERLDLREIDPENQLWARQVPRRLDAEMVRDNALAVSGLLSRRIGGPSIRPYQPKDYWRRVSPLLEPEYRPSRGEDQYRRGVYIYWKRNDLHPSLRVFDAPTREECTAERARSNTPLQALLLLNDPSFVEAARVLAERGVRHAPADPPAQVRWVYREVLARAPDAAASATLETLYDAHRTRFQGEPERARRVTAIGNSSAATNIDVGDLAALTSVCRVLLNLNETITRY